MIKLGWNYALYSELFKGKNEISGARDMLNKSIQIFKKCGSDGWVEKYEKKIAQL